MTSEPEAARAEEAPPVGLRSRKKQRTRLAIQDAALELFAEKGYDGTTLEEITTRAEVSMTTFFRYFASKGEVVLNDTEHRLQALCRAIIDRPGSESDLTAIYAAIEQHWLADMEPQRVMRQIQATWSSPLLLGIAFMAGTQWQRAVTEALSVRRGLSEPDDYCRLTATVSVVIFGDAVRAWAAAGGEGDLSEEMGRAFQQLAVFCAEAVRIPPKTPTSRAKRPESRPGPTRGPGRVGSAAQVRDPRPR